MKDLAEERYLIDVAEIWREERKKYEQDLINKAYYDTLYEELASYFLNKNHVPFIDVELLSSDPGLKNYYNRYDSMLKAKKGLLDFFKYKGSFYDMEESCIIKRGEVANKDFKKLFAHKIMQFENDTNREFVSFLYYHFQLSFDRDLNVFNNFLSKILDEQEGIISLFMKGKILWWIDFSDVVLFNIGDNQVDIFSSSEKTIEDKNIILGSDRDANLEGSSNNEFFNSSSSNENPSLDFTLIEGSFTLDEIQSFFSFLYKTNSEVDGSFLKKEEVDQIFKNGIALPHQPLANQFKLNYTARFPKKIVDYFIYWFIIKYNNKAKKDILIFFGHYLLDYNKALTAEGLETLNKNITGEGTKRIKLNYNDYLPTRFQ